MEERLLTTEDVAEQLQIDEQTVRRWIKSGKLRAFKPGRAWMISPASLEELLEGHGSPKARGARRRDGAPLGPGKMDRGARIEELAGRVRAGAQELEAAVVDLIPEPGSSRPFNGSEVYALSRAAYREYVAYLAHTDDLEPAPGRESQLLDGALVAFWRAWRIGLERSAARGAAWDLPPAQGAPTAKHLEGTPQRASEGNE